MPTDAALEPVPPADSPVLAFLRRVHDRHRLDERGTVATYIPELARADPTSFGIVIATVDGAVYEIGDTRVPFTIQSMAKPLTYAAILDLLGAAAVRARIGVEPTGDAFNAISLGAGTGMPLNPMVNAGAITAVGLVPDAAGAGPSRLDSLVASLSRFAGRQLGLDDDVYASERDTGHRNRAIAHLLRGTGAITDDPDSVVDAYFRVCSVAVTARDLALIAATLANGGRHPLTGEMAASDATVRDTLSVMATCGMYDGAGEWMYEVGLPAKSGVSGGIFAVLPGQLGIGVWSPPLDSRGNSVRGVAVCRDLARELDLHLVRGARPPSAVRTRASVAALPSKRARGAHERERITIDGDRSLVIELQGSLGFVAVETLARVALPKDGAADAVVVDLRRVERIDTSVAGLLADLVAALGARGAAVAWSGANPHGDALALVDDALARLRLAPPRRFAELDLAVEWAEDVVLARDRGTAAAARPSRVHVPLEAHPAFAGLGEGVVDCLRRVMDRRQLHEGEALVRHGDPAEELFLITGGRLSVWVPVGQHDARRLATLEAGQLVGELAFLGRERRTADVYCDSEVEAYVLTTDAFDALARDDPATATVFLATLLRIVSSIARRMTAEVAHLAS
ncbi:MAG TPA: glutaminase A [Candidatus Limnocylindrales bacterium]|nr:glutaminase A [Candidatus Limnocylindrales bacterium]